MKTALVTGGNRGIGEAIAHGLAREGLHVIVGAREKLAGQEVADAIKAQGGQASSLRLELTSAEVIAQAMAALESDEVEVDVLVNNAGVLENQYLIDMKDASVAEHIRVNALAPLRLIQALAPGMGQRGYGRVVNVSSGWGALNSLGPGAYGVTKAFLNAITIKLAEELPASIKINAMCPGWVRTRMGGQDATRDVDEAADTAIWLATLPDDGPTGGFFRDRKPIDWVEG
ncbi:MAG: SDR family NAD(P)-dependent oxidoreductase [Pseudomonadota bacterium]